MSRTNYYFTIGITAVAIAAGFLFGGPIWGFVFLAIGIIFLFLWFRARAEEGEGRLEDISGGGETPSPPEPKIPSLVFVFGAPLGDNDSSTWIMMLKHYGPSSAHNCIVEFFDDDRKNIEHLWLVANGSPPFLPLGQFDESQKLFHIPEAAVEGPVPCLPFNWSPIDPNRQHYTVSISCRDGVFAERWEVTRVEGVLRSRVVIERGPQWIRENPGANPVVFECKDPEFISAPLATIVPSPEAKKIVHPGWKPLHRFDLPVAIIDPNDHVQIAGIKQPDGGTLAGDPGCWNILTRHFGD